MFYKGMLYILSLSSYLLHLSVTALASRCLQLVVYFIPKVRQHFEEKLVSKNKSMLRNLDQVQKVSEIIYLYLHSMY